METDCSRREATEIVSSRLAAAVMEIGYSTTAVVEKVEAATEVEGMEGEATVEEEKGTVEEATAAEKVEVATAVADGVEEATAVAEKVEEVTVAAEEGRPARRACK